ncbi:MAG: SsrA-binding protein SmpB [Bacteroidia bacterium]|nr:SsrA-binding protein SmpB [Bacteroidia bacterium]
MPKEKKTPPTIRNKRASFEYQFLETLVVGLVLTGTEIKSVREGKVQIQDAFCFIQNDELFIKGMEISPYELGTYNNHEPKRIRKLLAHKHEIRKLKAKREEKGLTIIPVKLFFTEKNLAKLEIAIAKGKKLFDKRESIKERETSRNLKRIED